MKNNRIDITVFLAVCLFTLLVAQALSQGAPSEQKTVAGAQP